MKGSEKMQRLSIGAAKEYKEIENKILKEEEYQLIRDYYIQKKEKVGNIIFLNFAIDEVAVQIQNVKSKLASAVVDVMIHFGKFNYICRYIEKRYDFLEPEEKDAIYTRITKYFVEHKVEEYDSVLQADYRKVMVQRFIEMMQECNRIIIEGFMIFRLKEYIKRIKEIVNEIVEQYLVEKEYEEFIQLLRVFVKEQPTTVEKIHILPITSRTYQFYDANFQDITEQCIKEFIKDVGDIDFSHDDLLLSTLLFHAPNQIVIHQKSQFENNEILQTIERVFVNKVRYDETFSLKNPLDICDR